MWFAGLQQQYAGGGTRAAAGRRQAGAHALQRVPWGASPPRLGLEAWGFQSPTPHPTKEGRRSHPTKLQRECRLLAVLGAAIQHPQGAALPARSRADHRGWASAGPHGQPAAALHLSTHPVHIRPHSPRKKVRRQTMRALLLLIFCAMTSLSPLMNAADKACMRGVGSPQTIFSAPPIQSSQVRGVVAGARRGRGPCRGGAAAPLWVGCGRAEALWQPPAARRTLVRIGHTVSFSKYQSHAPDSHKRERAAELQD